MPTPFALEPGESIVLQEKGMIYRSKLTAYPGKLILTNKRLAFEQKPSLLHHPLIGGLAGWMVGKATDLLPLNAPLTDITNVERTKIVRNDKVLVIRTPAGEHTVMLNKNIDQWVQALVK